MILDRQIVEQRRQQRRERPAASEERIEGFRIEVLRNVENNLVGESDERHGWRGSGFAESFWR